MAKFLIDGGAPLSGRVKVSGNKNEALPALMACLLTDQPVILERVPKIGDVVTVCKILEKIGVRVQWQGDDVLCLDASGANSYSPPEELCTTARASILLMGPILARFGKINLPLPGGDVIGARRIDTHWEGMEALGATLKFGPIIRGEAPHLKGDEIFLDEPSVTATENLLLAAVTADGQTILHNAASEPHVVGLSNLLNKMGARISGVGSNRIEIQGVKKLSGAKHRIGPDFMEVGSFLCLGAIAKGRIEIEDIEPTDLRFVLKTFARLGIEPVIEGRNISVGGHSELAMKRDISGRISTIYSGPWPAFPTDLMSVAIVAATQSQGTIIFFEKMFEGRMFFTDKLMEMGANIVLCDPHRIVVSGPSPLIPYRMSSPDVRAGMALLMAALIAKGKSEIDNIYQIERGYSGMAQKLTGLGARITRVD